MTQRRELTETQEAMLEHFAYLNYLEHRPASWQDFALFEVNNKQYRLSHGTIKNNFSYLRRIKRIKLVYKDINAYYSLVECAMTPHHTSVTGGSKDYISRDLAALIDRMPFDIPAVHNIRLCFSCDGLWDRLRIRTPSDSEAVAYGSTSSQQLSMRLVSKDLTVPIMRLDQGVKAYITVAKTNTVSVILKCSKSESSVRLDPAGIVSLNRSLVRMQERLRSLTFSQ